MVFVSHSMEDVRRICDRVMWIDNHSVKMAAEADVVVAGYSNPNP
jgi:lipopolysaccharide transport system ATP-binding protein